MLAALAVLVTLSVVGCSRTSNEEVEIERAKDFWEQWVEEKGDSLGPGIYTGIDVSKGLVPTAEIAEAIVGAVLGPILELEVDNFSPAFHSVELGGNWVILCYVWDGESNISSTYNVVVEKSTGSVVHISYGGD